MAFFEYDKARNVFFAGTTLYGTFYLRSIGSYGFEAWELIQLHGICMARFSAEDECHAQKIAKKFIKALG